MSDQHTRQEGHTRCSTNETHPLSIAEQNACAQCSDEGLTAKAPTRKTLRFRMYLSLRGDRSAQRGSQESLGDCCHVVTVVAKRSSVDKRGRRRQVMCLTCCRLYFKRGLVQIRTPDRPIKWIGRDTGRLATGPIALQVASRSVTLLECLDVMHDHCLQACQSTLS